MTDTIAAIATGYARTAIGILRKNGETVKLRDFLRIGVPFTLSAVLAGYVYIWLVWGI